MQPFMVDLVSAGYQNGKSIPCENTLHTQFEILRGCIYISWGLGRLTEEGL